MKKLTATTVTIAVWLTAVSSAAALTYSLSRPLVPPEGPIDATGERREAKSVIEYARAAPPAILAVEARQTDNETNRSNRIASTPIAPRQRDISEMRCSTWRHLALGPIDQGVRYCE